MTQPAGTQRIPLSPAEKARAEANFSPYVAQALAARGRFRVSADTSEMVELFQQVARRVGDLLQRPVISYANGREIVITFGQEEPPGITGQRSLVRGTGSLAVRRPFPGGRAAVPSSHPGEPVGR